MPRKKSKTLTEAELRIMEALWSLGEGSVKEVTDTMPPDDAVAYNTVLTMLRILKQKGYVDYHKRGRAFIYYPLIDRGQARTNVVRYLVSRFFNDSPSLLVQNLLENEDLDPTELARLKNALESEEDRDAT